jgi:branched-chain amino acid transport system permease protein
MNPFLTNVFAGLALGSTYALVALGFVVIYKSTGVINFA